MMRRLSISARLILAFLLILAALVTIAILVMTSVPRLVTSVNVFQEQLLQELAVFEDIRVSIADAVHLDQAYILSSGDEVYDEAFEADIDEIERLLAAHAVIHRTVPLTPLESAELEALRTAVNRLAGAHDHVDELIVQQRLDEARRVSATEGRTAAREALAAVRALVTEERHDATRYVADVVAGTGRLYRILLGVAVITSVLSAGVALSVTRSVTVPVRRLVDVTRRVDRGSLDIRTGLRRDDEIGELAQSFDRMIGRLQDAFAEQERFLGDISHELRTPVTIVRGHLEVLRRGAKSAEQVARAITISLDELDRMNRLVNDLLLLVRATRPDFLVPQPIALDAFLGEVLQKAQAMAVRGWQRGPAPPLTITADRDRLTQALLNLLRNAVEHTQAHQTIELSAASADGWVEIRVRDDGEGIPADEVPHIFERFRRGTPGGDRAGLGLSIVQAIARAHGGDVLVHSRYGAGSTFTLRLPAPDYKSAS